MRNTMICQVLLVYFLISVDARSLQKVSDKNVTKRAANGEFFPDWVPFKNKHGDELGEFVQVEPKKKPKKRLALPTNFKLKAVAAPDNDYDDFGAGPGDAEGEDFEKKEWSDVNRPAVDNTPVKLINHTDISDIDGVVNIITQPKPSIVRLINVKKSAEKPATTQKPEVTTMKPEIDDYSDQSQDTEAPRKLEREEREPTEEREDKEEKEYKEEKEGKEEKEEKKNSENEKQTGDSDKNQNDDEYEDEQKTKEKDEQTEKERKESEARKALILDAVDELKARHQAEQRILSEKAKEDEIFKEEHERDKIDFEDGRDKYDRKKPKLDHYVDYDDSIGSSTYDKYKINVETTTVKTTTTTRPTTRRARKPKKRTKPKRPKPTDSGKLSVFKNPGAYIIEEETTTSTTTTTTTPKPKRRDTTRFSSRYRYTGAPSPPKSRDGSLRISLVPDPADSEGSPTLFFPQTKNRRKKKRGKATLRASTSSPDSHVAETIADKTAKNLTEELPQAFKISGLPARTTTTTTDKITTLAIDIPDTTGSDTKVVDTNTGPSGAEIIAVDSEAVADVVAASTDKKEDKKGGNYEHKRGGGREYSSSHEDVHEEHGKKAYEGKHEDTRQAKGHHDKEDHSGEYVDRAGSDKSHHDEAKHYGHHHHEEHGKKNAKYEESGKHSKGHSTKGSHDIHKKEEYEKRVEFFEEDGDSDEEEKHGGYNHERGHKSGGNFKKGKLEAGHHHHDKGDTGHHQKGGHAHGHKGHKQSGGHDGHGRHHEAHFKKQGHQTGKKWAHAHASPGKIANLIAVDRRADQLYSGPQYYG